MSYRQVEPRDHDQGCRRGLDSASAHYGLDRDRCERCRNLWQRLAEAGERRRAPAPRTIFDLPIAGWAIAGDEADHEGRAG